MCRRDGHFVIVRRCCSLCSRSPHWCGQGFSFHDIKISMLPSRSPSHSSNSFGCLKIPVDSSASPPPPPFHLDRVPL